MKKILFILTLSLLCAGMSWAQNVAKIGSVGYATLQEAIDAAMAGETVVLLTDIDYGDPFAGTTVTDILTVAADDEIVLDFNGHTVSAAASQLKNSFILRNKGTLTLIDHTVDDATADYDNGEGGGFVLISTASDGGSYSTQTTTIANNGTLNLRSGRVYADNTLTSARNLTFGIHAASGTLNMYGGYVRGRSAALYQGVFNGETSTVNIHGGTLVSVGAGLQTKMYGNAVLNIDGGNILSEASAAIFCSDGNASYSQTINISGGTITGQGTGGYGIQNYYANSTINISSGQISGNNGILEYPYYGASATNTSEYNITGGTITGTNSGIHTVMYGNVVLNIDGGNVASETGNGINCSDGDALYSQTINISGGTISGGGEGNGITNYWSNSTINISGGQISGDYGIFEYPYYPNDGTSTSLSQYNITGGTITGTNASDNAAIYVQHNLKPSHVTVEQDAVIQGYVYAAEWNSGWVENQTDYFSLLGGCYLENPNDYVAESYGTFNESNCQAGYYSVEKKNWLTFNANIAGSTGTMDTLYFDPRTPQTCNSIPDCNFINPDGVNFLNWNTKADGSGDTYAVGSTMEGIVSDTVLYAQWAYAARIGNTYYTTLNAAAAAVPVGTPTTITILTNLNFYDITSSNLTNKTITFTGVTTDTLIITPDNGDNAYLVTASGADLTFETITLWNPMEPDGKDRGIAHLNRLTINNCEVIGFMRGYASIMFTCNNCIFTKSGKYHLWTYGANCTFNHCVFNSSYDGKAINVYWNDVTDPYRVITFNDCAFNSDPVSNGSAIQINSASTCFVVNINNCTTSGYNNPSSCIGSLSGNEAHSHLVNNKTGCATVGRTTLYIDGVQILKQSDCDPVAMIGDTYYQTLQAAVDAAHAMTGAVTIEVISDAYGRTKVDQDQANLQLTIKGNGHSIFGTIWVDGQGSNWKQDNTLTVTNVNFKHNSECTNCYGSNKGFIYIPSKSEIGDHYNYAHDVTIKDCDFDDGGAHNVGCFWMPTNSGTQGNIKLENITVTSAHSLVQLNGASFRSGSGSDTAIIIKNCDAVGTVKHGINITGGGGKFIITDNNIKATAVSGEGYSIRIKDQTGGACVSYLENNEFHSPAEGMIFTNNTAAGDTIYFISGRYDAFINDSDSPTNFSITGGTWNPSQLDKVIARCAPGYYPYLDEGDTTYTVLKMYWVTYDANGGDGSMEPSYVAPFPNTSFTTKNNEFTWTTTFTNWNTKADGTGDTYAEGDPMVISSDTTLYAQWNIVATVGGKAFSSLQAAVDHANNNLTGDVTIDLVKNTSEYVEVLQKNTNNLIINGNGNTLDGQMLISAKGENWDGTDNITVTNMNFTYNSTYFDGDVADPNNEMGLLTFCKNCGTDRIRSIYNYAHNVTISNCNFDADGSSQGAYAIASVAGSVNHLVIDNCTAKNAKALASLQSDPQFVLTNCSTEDVKYGIRIVNNDGPMTVTHNIFNADEAGILIEYMTSGATINFAEDTVNAPKAFEIASTSTSGTLDITSGKYIGTIDDNSTSDFFNISGGTYSKDVSGEPCAPGYAAFDNDDGTWTVMKAWFLYYDKNQVGASGTMDTSFVKQDGTVVERTLVVANCDFTWLPNHSFLAWNTKADASGDTLHPGDNIILSSDTTLYVIWQEGYTVFYDNNGGTGTIPNQYKAVGETITLSDGTGFSRTDSTLYWWNTAANESGIGYALGAEYSDNANLTLYAAWRLNLDMKMDSTDVVCYGENNGTDTVKIIGGEMPFKLVLSGTEDRTVENIMTRTYVFENLKPGSYTVTLTDTLNKDIITGTFTIAQPDTLVVESMTVPEKPCPLMGVGEYNVSMTTTGGNGGNHFAWSDAAVDVDAMATTVIPGADDRDSTYTVKVTVTDKKGCTAEGTATFSVSPVIADDGTVHSNSKLTIDTIKQGIMSGCDTVIREFGTPHFTSTHPEINEGILDTIYNDIPTSYPDSVFSLGENVVIWTAVDTCGHMITGEQIILIYHYPCPNVTDVDGNDYTSVRLGCDCWMAKNLRTSKYSDGRTVSNLMKYESPTHPDADANFAIYGYLYDWTAALDAENGVTTDAEGLVQGICPTGWHMPTDIDFMRIAGNGTVTDMFDLRYHGYWLDGGGDNSTGFSLLPGGFYNDNTARYENILGEAYLWSVNSADPSQPKVFWADCHCYMWQVGNPSANMGCSVRCVKD